MHGRGVAKNRGSSTPQKSGFPDLGGFTTP
jgi:hypothetical protein